MKRVFLFIIAALVVAPAPAQDAGPLPRPPELEPDIEFWTRIYTEVDTESGLLHDAERLDVVYEVVNFPVGSNNRAKRRLVKEAKRRYKDILLALGRGKRQNLTDEEQRVLELWPRDADTRTLRTAARRIRFQLGQSDKFREGLIRAGAWEGYIRRTLSDMGIPMELIALPHVESSFNPTARSRVGAAGLWQFTRSTGRRYLRIDAAVDERMDPFVSTVAAARLLKHNHDVTGSWPLAITAYNHGAAGVRRAVRKLGTNDISTIVRRYDGRIFGFASRNFYVAFLAAAHVHFNAEKYFGRLERAAPSDSEVVHVPAYVTITTLQRTLAVDRTTLRQHNPALRRAVWQGTKYVPRGYALRIPQEAARGAAAALADITASAQYEAQTPDRFYKVRRGNTLAGIAARFNVSLNDLIAMNGLQNQHYIRVGQVLRLPFAGSDDSASLAGKRAAPADAIASSDGLYRVQYGDTLSVIADRFGVDEEKLVLVNQLTNKNRIRTGQILRVANIASDVADTVAIVRSPHDTRPLDAPVVAVRKPETTEVATAELESAEPASAEEAEMFGPTLPVGAHPALSADPSDYSVASDDSIEVQAAETLGHYAEWLEVRTARLRKINNMRYGQPVVIGQRRKLVFSEVSREVFEQRRLVYHRTLQEAFFMQYQITGTHSHVLQRGESLWILAKERYDVPVWLLRQYNPDVDFNAVLPGTTVVVPNVESRRDVAPRATPIPSRPS